MGICGGSPRLIDEIDEENLRKTIELVIEELLDDGETIQTLTNNQDKYRVNKIYLSF